MLPDRELRRRLGSADGAVSADDRVASVAYASFVPFVVQLALCDSVALFRFVLGFLSRSPLPIVPFGLGAVALLLSVPPNVDRFSERVRRLSLLGE
jgi:hypothetical protein